MYTNPIKLIALDLDDTLLDHNHAIPEANRLAIAEAEEAGVHVVLASGRTPHSMIHFARELGMDTRGGLLISYNGASVRDCSTLVEEWGARLPRDVLFEIWDWCMAEGLSFQTYTDEGIMVNHENEYTALDAKLTGVPNIVVDRQTLCAEPRVKCLIPGDAKVLSTITPILNQRFAGRAVFFTSKPYFLEVMPPGADKGHALEKLASIHGYEKHEVMAMGDAMNDLGMISWAGYGIAMANARDEVKQAAYWVTTKNNHEGGVAEAIGRFVFGRTINS